MVGAVQISEARTLDHDGIRALLRSAGLNGDSVFEGDSTIIVAKVGDADLVGVAGIAWHEPDALLRSVAVADSARGLGIGAKLVRSALDAMRQRGTGCAYLLTNDADAYFARYGFKPVDRADVAGPITTNPQFVTECPVSAIVMQLRLVGH